MELPGDAQRRVLIQKVKTQYRMDARLTVALLTIAAVGACSFAYFILQPGEGGWAVGSAALAVAAFFGAYWCSEERDRAAESLTALGAEIPSNEEWLPTAIVTALISGAVALLAAYMKG